MATISISGGPLAHSSTAYSTEYGPQEPPIVIIEDSDTYGWLRLVRDAVYEHGEVQFLYISLGDDMVVDYWILIPSRDITLVRAIVEQQQERIIKLFAMTQDPPFQLDYHIVYLNGREPAELVPSDAIPIPKP